MVEGPRDLVSIVEAAYCVHDEDAVWLREVMTRLRPHLDVGLGVAAALYDQDEPDPARKMRAMHLDGIDPRVALAMRGAFEAGSDEERALSLASEKPILRLTSWVGPLAESPIYSALARELGFSDVVGVRGGNPDRTGIVLAAPVQTLPHGSRAWETRWTRLAAHLAAGLRLHRAALREAGDRATRAAAVLGADSKVLSANPAAASARETLRAAAKTIDRARSSKGRRAPDAALEEWTALVDGRWSLVDHFESDGRRFVLAMENAPDAPDPRALAPSERALVGYLAMGHATKLIAYELGLPEGTVSTRTRAVMRKLGVRTRAELVERFATLRATAFERATIVGEPLVIGLSTDPASELDALTAAEREVARLAARGRRNAEIARARGTSERTVANLLQAVYRKLRIGSRTELARHLARTSAPPPDAAE